MFATREVKKLKSYVSRALSGKIKITSASRGDYHIRFPLDGDPSLTLSKIGLRVEERPGASISSKFDTFNLVTIQDIQDIPMGTTLAWVNNNVGASSKTKQLFNNKDLSPDTLGLAGKTMSTRDIMLKTRAKLKSIYDVEIVESLMCLLEDSDKKGTTIKISKKNDFTKKDLAKVSADFGEIMAGIWAMKNLKFKQVSFPLASNEKLIDFYGLRFGVPYPISVKSGGGGKVTIKNIIDAIENRAKTAGADLSKEKSLGVFNIVSNYSMRDQMIMLHQYMETDAIKRLARIMKMDYKRINLKSLTDWLNSKSREETIKELEPFWKSLNTKLTDKILEGSDSVRLVISPLGESIWKILNESKEIKESLNNVARQVTLIQVNVDVMTNQIKFSSNFFREAKFEFGWAGYSAGNKLGFKMKLEK